MFANANLQLQLALKPTDYFFVEREREREKERCFMFVRSLALELHPVVFLWFNLGRPCPQAWACVCDCGWVWRLGKKVSQALNLLILGIATTVPVVDDAFNVGLFEVGLDLVVVICGALSVVFVASSITITIERW